MSHTDCGIIREHLPDYAAGRLDDEAAARVEEHLPSCAECAAEHDLIRLLLEAPPAVPAGLADEVVAGVRATRRVPSRPWWGISAAAVAALALGIGVSTGPPATDDPEVPVVAETEEGELWMSDDGLLAGAPSVDGLSDEDLMLLLEELSMEAGA